MKPIRLEPEASEELQEAARWYNAQRPDLGDDLLRCVSETLDLAARLPQAGALHPLTAPELGIRRIPVRRFPYHVIYLETSDAIRVLAVAHDKRKPGYWRSRM